MRARLLSLFVMLSFGMQPFAAMLVGYSAEVVTTPIAIVIYGALLVISSVGMLILRPGLRIWEVEKPKGVTGNQPTSVQPEVQLDK